MVVSIEQMMSHIIFSAVNYITRIHDCTGYVTSTIVHLSAAHDKNYSPSFNVTFQNSGNIQAHGKSADHRV